MTLEVQVLTCDRHKKDLKMVFFVSVICYVLFCVCHKSGPEPLTSYVMVFFVSVTSQDLNL
jgi:hypothetical protein